MLKTPQIEAVNYRITVTSRELLAMDVGEGASPYVVHLPFEIRQAELLVGEGLALLLLVPAAKGAGHSTEALFDCVDDDVLDLYGALYDPASGALRAGLGAGDGAILYLQSVKVIAAHRGRNLGLLAAQRLRVFFGSGAALMALSAAPIEFDEDGIDAIDGRVYERPFARTGESASEALRAYWSTLGFRRVGETRYMAFDMAQRAPVIGSSADGV